MTEILCAGSGGQGVLVTGNILAHAGMDSGKNITWYPSYGSEMRGGTANCNVKISSDEIASPYVKNADILICLNEVSIDKFESIVKPNGLMVVNTSMIQTVRTYRDDIKVVEIPATEIAEKLGNTRGINLVILGAVTKASGLFELDFFRDAIDKFFSSKGKLNPKNAECFDAGAAYIEG